MSVPPAQRHYLNVPYAERRAAKAAAEAVGTSITFDRERRAWYVPAEADFEPFRRWEAKAAEQWSPAKDPVEEFGAALEAAGLRLEGPPIMDGDLHRVPVEGDHGHERSGAYKGYLDGHPAGYVKNWKTGFEERWKAALPTPAFSAEERAQLRAEWERQRVARRAERERQYADAALRAEARFEKAKQIDSDDGHPYLVAKHVPAYGGVRVDRNGSLLVPVTDTRGKLQSLMAIGPTGEKSLQKGGRAAGGMCVLVPGASSLASEMVPALPGEAKTIFVAEGYATAGTVARATGRPAVVSFSAGNLEAVARALHAEFPGALIAIAGDNDHLKEESGHGNVGRTKAQEAARAVDGVAVLPPFMQGERGSDWNDFEVLFGAGAGELHVREAIHVQLQQAREMASHRPGVALDSAGGSAELGERDEGHASPGGALEVRPEFQNAGEPERELER